MPKRKADAALGCRHQRTSVKLGNGAEMPLVGLGTWKSAPGCVGAAVKAAIECGYRHIDCAHCYNNEKEIGDALVEVLNAGTVARSEIFVTSKLWNTKHGEDQVVGAIKHTLAQLQLSYLDLYLIHWPHAFQKTLRHDENFPKHPDGTGPVYDFETSFVETWRGMEEAHRLGLCKTIGVSNFNHKQIAELMRVAHVPPSVNQVECHPLLPQRPLLEFCSAHRIVLTAYSPLGSPDAKGRRPDDPSLLSDARITEIGAEYGKTPAQVLVRFQTQRGIVAIPKSETPKYMKQNLDTFFELSAWHLAELEDMETGFRYGANKRDKEHPLWPFHEPF